MKTLKAIGLRLVELVRAYPARSISITVALVVFVGAKFGVVVDQQGLGAALAYALPVLIGGEATHRRVRPVR